MVEQSEGNSSLHCCVIGGKYSFEGFLDLGPGLVCICNAFVFELDEPSLVKGFFLSFGHPIEANHGSHFIGVFVCMKGKVVLHGHEPSIGISGFSAKLFREGSFDFHVVVCFVGKRIYVDGKTGEPGSKESGDLGGDGAVGGTGRSKYCIWIRSPNGVTDHKWKPLKNRRVR